jgi:hypothetical protein
MTEEQLKPIDMADIDFFEIDYFEIDYFEKGCLCVLSGRINKALSRDDTGLQYYLDNCTCTRHPDSASRECWDRDDVLRAAALEKINNKINL